MGTTPAAAYLLASKRLRPSGAIGECRSICGATSAEARLEGGQFGSKRCVTVPTRTSPAGANGSPSERVAAAQNDLIAAATFVGTRSTGAALDGERPGSRPGGARRTRAPPVVAEGSSSGQDGLPDGVAFHIP